MKELIKILCSKAYSQLKHLRCKFLQKWLTAKFDWVLSEHESDVRAHYLEASFTLLTSATKPGSPSNGRLANANLNASTILCVVLIRVWLSLMSSLFMLNPAK